MNIRKLAWKNLFRRKSRAVFTGLGIFLGIATFVALASLTAQMEQAVQDRLDRFGANILITPRSEQLSLGFGDISLGGTQVAHSRLTAADEKAIRGIEMKERLRSVVPFFLTAADASGKNVIWMGIPAMEIEAARPWWRISGSPIREKGEILLGSEAAAVLDKGPGGSVVSGGRMFRVTGVLQPTGEKEDGMIIASIGDAQSLARNPGGVTFFEVAALCKDCPVEDIVGQIGAALPGARVSAIRQVVESRKAAVDQFRRLGIGVSAIVLAIGGLMVFVTVMGSVQERTKEIGGLMVFVTVMGSVQERTKEIGVLRAVGFRRRAILSLLFWETGWISLLSSVSGSFAGIAAALLAAPHFGVEHAGVASSPALLGVGLGMGLGLLGTIPPARRAAGLSPTEAMRSL